MSKLDKKNIAIIIPDFDFGGEEKRVVFFANNYLSYFNKVVVISPEGKSLDLLDKRVKHITMNLRNMVNIPKCMRILKKEGISYLQGHKRITMPYLYAAEKFLNIESVFNFDNIYLKYNSVCSYITPRHILYLSDILKDFYVPYYPRKRNVTVNMGGEFFKKLSAEKVKAFRESLKLDKQFVLLSLGRLSYQKNHALLIEALSLVRDLDFTCLIAGTGPLEQDIKILAERKNIQDKVVFLGHRTDIELLLNSAQALIQSSHFEGFPNVFIEAASVGLPIVATDVGSSSTLIDKNGLLVHPGDAIALSESIRTVISEYNTYREGAETLKDSNFLRQFHKDEMLNNYIAYYETIG